MTVLAMCDADAKPRNLFTYIRHRQQEALGPWAGDPDETWSADDIGHGLRLFTLDAPYDHCLALIEHVLGGSTLGIDGLDVQYSLVPKPRRHWAYRDKRPLSEASFLSPFSLHSAEVTEYWSLAAEPRERWLKVLELSPSNLTRQLDRLGFPLDRCWDRVGNLVIAGAQDEITCELIAHRNRKFTLDIDGKGSTARCLQRLDLGQPLRRRDHAARGSCYWGGDDNRSRIGPRSHWVCGF